MEPLETGIKKWFCGITLEELTSFALAAGYSEAHALKCVTGFYRKRLGSFSEMADLPLAFRKLLDRNFSTDLLLPGNAAGSADGSVKYLFSAEGGKLFETVFIPEKNRKTVCISTQSGCRMGCPFCLTSKIGYRGDLTAGDMINQVLSFPHSRNITHVVFMGMGEPLDNLDEVLKACHILTASWGLSLSPAHVTVSTVGLTAGVEKFLRLSGCNLTLSLYSPFASERLAAVPAERANPVKGIISMMKSFPVSKRRRFTVAYLMMKGINDTDRHLEELTVLLKNTGIRVNLLPYHSTGTDCTESTSATGMQNFREKLYASGISASVRRSRGADISAACGMLAAGRINN
jgi:23S rRNA (adenine2503-C2)-methyltransferase